MAEGFEAAWTLEVHHPDPERLARALAPESGDRVRLEADEALRARGEGSTGESLHALDDLLACLTGALAADRVDEPGEAGPQA